MGLADNHQQPSSTEFQRAVAQAIAIEDVRKASAIHVDRGVDGRLRLEQPNPSEPDVIPRCAPVVRKPPRGQMPATRESVAPEEKVQKAGGLEERIRAALEPLQKAKGEPSAARKLIEAVADAIPGEDPAASHVLATAEHQLRKRFRNEHGRDPGAEDDQYWSAYGSVISAMAAVSREQGAAA
jgi:hypothetical protein